jgi:hypothetical protein
MRAALDRVRTRLIPALLTALGITFLAAGMLSFSKRVDAGPGVEARASDPPPSASGAPLPTASPQPSPSETPIPLITLPPLGSPGPATPAPIPGDRVATRVRIAGLDIDLPVVKPPAGYPLCNVAMYYVHPEIGQPGEGKSVYLYAHARTGMFLPLLTAS